jgi:hypothetical protein
LLTIVPRERFVSVALYIVLERPVPGLDHRVNGKALGHADDLLDALAKKAGSKPLMQFFSLSPQEMSKFALSHGMEAESETPFPAEQWFRAEEGLATIRGLKGAAKAGKIENLEKILSDLDEFERVLEAAREHGVGWHVAVDY